MGKRDTDGAGRPEATSTTLGDVLYAKPQPIASEAEWLDLVHTIAEGRQASLHALYQRSHRVVFTLALRITCSRESAEEVTLDVFHDVWRRAAAYDPANGTVLGWIMNQARSRAIDRVRFEHRKKRADPRLEAEEPELAPDPLEALDLLQRSAAVRAALAALTSDERRAIESSFFADLTHAEIAERSREPLGTVKTRIRSGLRKLREVLDAQGEST